MGGIETNETLFICECGNTEHQVIMQHFDDEHEVYMTVHLCKEPNIFRRFVTAVKYLFGHTSVYGDFDEFIFQAKDYKKLQKVVNHLKEFYKKNEALESKKAQTVTEPRAEYQTTDFGSIEGD